jgi:CMP-N,N'-diacetyllegionaminic acid synthase
VSVIALGIIPARGGSKQVPRKNLRLLAGKPLLVHTVEAALASRRLDRLAVSTDSDEIADVALAAGAEVVRRPPELATDVSPTEDALIHSVKSLAIAPLYVVTLEPTSPLRRPETIDECIERALDLQADAILTVVRTTDCFGRVVGGVFQHLEPGQPRRRQDRAALYRESSTVYVTRTTHLFKARSVLAESTFAVEVAETEALDINTEHDLEVAEALLQVRARARATDPSGQ